LMTAKILAAKDDIFKRKGIRRLVLRTALLAWSSRICRKSRSILVNSIASWNCVAGLTIVQPDIFLAESEARMMSDKHGRQTSMSDRRRG
jgi:hypothetical protein